MGKLIRAKSAKTRAEAHFNSRTILQLLLKVEIACFPS